MTNIFTPRTDDLVSRHDVLLIVEEQRRNVKERSPEWYALNRVWRGVDRMKLEGAVGVQGYVPKRPR